MTKRNLYIPKEVDCGDDFCENCHFKYWNESRFPFRLMCECFEELLYSFSYEDKKDSYEDIKRCDECIRAERS